MARLRTLQIDRHPDVDVPLTLSFSLGTSVVFGPDGPSRRRLMALLCGVTTGDFSYTDQPLDLLATFAIPGGEAEVHIARTETGGPVSVTQGEETRTIEEPPEGHRHLICDGTDALLMALHNVDGLRAPQWLPPALAHTAHQSEAGAPVEVNLRGIPELAGLWWHLDYERGFITLTEPGGRLDLKLHADDVVRSIADLTAEQRALASMYLYLSCRPTPFFDAPLDHLSDEAVDDLLRHVEPPMFGGVPRRQSFFAADSSALLYRMLIKRPEDVQQALVVCRPGVPWRKLDEAEAAKYYQFYEREFRHIDSLMRLW